MDGGRLRLGRARQRDGAAMTQQCKLLTSALHGGSPISTWLQGGRACIRCAPETSVAGSKAAICICQGVLWWAKGWVCRCHSGACGMVVARAQHGSWRALRRQRRVPGRACAAVEHGRSRHPCKAPAPGCVTGMLLDWYMRPGGVWVRSSMRVQPIALRAMALKAPGNTHKAARANNVHACIPRPLLCGTCSWVLQRRVAARQHGMRSATCRWLQMQAPAGRSCTARKPVQRVRLCLVFSCPCMLLTAVTCFLEAPSQRAIMKGVHNAGMQQDVAPTQQVIDASTHLHQPMRSLNRCSGDSVHQAQHVASLPARRW